MKPDVRRMLEPVPGWRYRLFLRLGLKQLAKLYAYDHCSRCNLILDPRNRIVLFRDRDRSLFGRIFDDGVLAVLHRSCFPSWFLKL